MITNNILIKDIKLNIEAIRARGFSTRHGFEGWIDYYLRDRSYQIHFVLLT